MSFSFELVKTGIEYQKNAKKIIGVFGLFVEMIIYDTKLNRNQHRRKTNHSNLLVIADDTNEKDLSGT